MAHGREPDIETSVRETRVRANPRARQPRWLAPAPATLAVAVILLAGADCGTRLVGETLIPGGPLDELAHLLTTLLVFWGLGSRASERVLVPALIASVAIDSDHIPTRLGADWLTVGTPRPYTHSLLTIVVVVAIAVFWRRRRDLLLGVAIGLAIHFWRDMGEGASGVSVLWPVSYNSFQYPHGVYVAVMTAFVVLDAALCAQRTRSIDGPARWRPRAPQSETL
jgi:inner membrane protein